MTLAPEPWYSSSLFWAIAAVVVAIALGIGAIVATYRSANPKRRLFVYASNITPLMHETGTDLGLEVRAGGETLTDPHVVTANVVSRGRRDIRKDAFDGPIQLHFTARIVGILETSCETKVPGTPRPPCFYEGDTIEIPPALLRRDHELTFTVLVEGEPPSFTATVPVEAEVSFQSAPTPVLVGELIVKIAGGIPVFGKEASLLARWILKPKARN